MKTEAAIQRDRSEMRNTATEQQLRDRSSVLPPSAMPDCIYVLWSTANYRTGTLNNC